MAHTDILSCNSVKIQGKRKSGGFDFGYWEVAKGGMGEPAFAEGREGRTVPLFVPLRHPGAKGRARRPCLAWRGTVRPSLGFGVFFVNIYRIFRQQGVRFEFTLWWVMKLTISINL
jgi:hypothetical protein